MSKIAVENSIELEVIGNDVMSFGTFSITGLYDEKVTIDGNRVFTDKLICSVSEIKLIGGFIVPMTFFIMNASYNYIFLGEKKVFLEGDESDEVPVVGVLQGATKNSVVKLRIKEAGQDFAEAI